MKATKTKIDTSHWVDEKQKNLKSRLMKVEKHLYNINIINIFILLTIKII